VGARRRKIQASDLQGFKYFKLIPELLETLRDVGTERDKAGNREFFCDHYLSLLLLYFFSPVVTSFNGLREASELEKVQKRLGIPRVSIGTLSEAGSVFDPTPVQHIIRELAGQALPLHRGREAEALQGLTAVDGSVLKALPRMAWALWQDEDHRGLKLHLHFDVFRPSRRPRVRSPANSKRTWRLIGCTSSIAAIKTIRCIERFSMPGRRSSAASRTTSPLSCRKNVS